MKKLFLLIVACFCMAQTKGFAIPSQITYQGTLKNSGVSIDVPKTMTFQLVSADGRTPYSLIISSLVPVHNGLFSIPLDFQLTAPYTWDTINPYILVTVEGQALGPIEPVTATVYAYVSNTVVDGSITPAKINTLAFQAAGPGLVPAGAIMMFDRACPAGWTSYATLNNNNLFPRGSNTFSGLSGGSATHTHSISTDGAHNHGGLTGQGDSPGVSDAGANFGNQNGWHRHSISTDGAHNHGGSTGNASSLPPYLDLIFCQKQ